MSLWSRIVEAFEALGAGESLSDVFQKLSSQPEKTVAFAIAVIGLSAKMAKADGMVTRNEVTAFREVFYIDPSDEKHAAKIFNLAREDVAGFETYARSIRRMFKKDEAVLVDLLEGLFHIATADNVYHPNEDRFLFRVAEIFEMPNRQFAAIRSRFVPDATPDPYAVLGADPTENTETIRKRWRNLVSISHPDKMMARGVPEEAIKLATKKLIAINDAWEAILLERGEAK